MAPPQSMRSQLPDTFSGTAWAVAILFGAMSIPVVIFGLPRPFLASTTLAGILIYLAAVDIRTLRLPNHATLPLGLLGIVTTITIWPTLLTLHIISALLIGGVLWALSAGWIYFRGRDALGLGDVKLAAAAALWIGPAAIKAILIAATLALAAGLMAILLGRSKPNNPAPFGPFLSFGIWTMWCMLAQVASYWPMAI